jgi:inner membrane protein
VAVGLAAARLKNPPAGVSGWIWTPLLVMMSLLPDVDVIAFPFGIPYEASFGHRGAAHSIAFAAAVAVLLGAAARRCRVSAMAVAASAGLVVASHGLLDTMTDGGRGIALLWPLTEQRYFAPWRPIPVAPIGARILSPAGLRLMAHEAALFAPVWLLAAWPRRKPVGHHGIE